MGNRLGGRFALTARKYAFLGRRVRADRLGNALFNSVLQPLGGTGYILTLAVARELINRFFSVKHAVHLCW